MEAIRKQAAKLREQVARQQQVGFFLFLDFCVLGFRFVSGYCEKSSNEFNKGGTFEVVMFNL